MKENKLIEMSNKIDTMGNVLNRIKVFEERKKEQENKKLEV